MAFFNGIKSGFYISGFLYALFYMAELVFKREKGSLSPFFIFLLFSIGLLFFRTPDYDRYFFLTERLTDFKNFFPHDWLRLYFAPLASGGTLQDYFNLFFTLFLCLGFLFFERKIVSVFSRNKINFGWWFIAVFLLVSWESLPPEAGLFICSFDLYHACSKPFKTRLYYKVTDTC